MSSMIPWAGGGRGWSDPFSWDVWDPSAGGRDWMWDSSAFGRNRRDDTAAIARAYVDWRETADAHVFTAEIPGVKKEEVKVEVEDGNILKISGERAKEEEDKNDTWHRVERSRGSFSRMFRLPENAKMDEVRCALANGVLTVTVPKRKSTSADRSRNVRTIDVA